MNDAADLSRLHDIVEPSPVAWWPLAPGWYGLITLTALALGYLLLQAWSRWRANAYRREALRELEGADSVAAVSELLRRTALASTPRSTLAALTGSEWPLWLSERSPVVMPDEVKQSLTADIYRPQAGSLAAVKAFAAAWIRRHGPTQEAAA